MTKSKKSSSLMSYAGTFGALVILCVVLAIASPNFFKYSNMMSVLKQTSFNALVSTGMLLCLITAIYLWAFRTQGKSLALRETALASRAKN